MQTEKIVSLPVLDGKKMIGLVSISDVLKADMDVYDNEILAKAKTPYKNVVETLDGTLQAGDIEGYRIVCSIIKTCLFSLNKQVFCGMLNLGKR